jgi:predicted DNA-binding transcriptional regulator AlpA
MEEATTLPILLDVAKVRRRYSDMPRSTLYRLIKEGRMPAPSYPFGPNRPYWHIDALVAFEKRNSQQLEAA